MLFTEVFSASLVQRVFYKASSYSKAPTAHFCAPGPQSPKFACSPLPHEQYWFVYDRTDNILPSLQRAHKATQCLAGKNKATSNEACRISHLMVSVTMMIMERLSNSFVAFVTIVSLEYNMFQDNDAFHSILD